MLSLSAAEEDADFLDDHWVEEVPPSAPASQRREAGSMPVPGLRRAASGTWGSAPRAGTILAGKYEVREVLSQGEREFVVAARHLDFEQSVIVRYLSPQAAACPRNVARFLREARYALGLCGAHAERVIDCGVLSSGSPFRVAEQPKGPSLAEILEVRERLPTGEALQLLLQLCEGVHEAHTRQVTYRSLNPSAVFVERRPDGSPRARILDLGASESFETELRQSADRPLGGQLLGRQLAYAAPEQVREPSTVDQRADVWALGAILYEALSGQRAFSGERPAGLLAMIVADEPRPLREIDPTLAEPLARLVHRCLNKDRRQRPQSVLELAAQLTPFTSLRSLPDVSAAAVTLIGHPAPASAEDAHEAPPVRRSAAKASRPPPPRPRVNASMPPASSAAVNESAPPPSSVVRYRPAIARTVHAVPAPTLDELGPYVASQPPAGTRSQATRALPAVRPVRVNAAGWALVLGTLVVSVLVAATTNMVLRSSRGPASSRDTPSVSSGIADVLSATSR
jgi:serine/threonine protein kinase